jgi:hypothetical protein
MVWCKDEVNCNQTHQEQGSQDLGKTPERIKRLRQKDWGAALSNAVLQCVPLTSSSKLPFFAGLRRSLEKGFLFFSDKAAIDTTFTLLGGAGPAGTESDSEVWASPEDQRKGCFPRRDQKDLLFSSLCEARPGMLIVISVCLAAGLCWACARLGWLLCGQPCRNTNDNRIIFDLTPAFMLERGFLSKNFVMAGPIRALMGDFNFCKVPNQVSSWALNSDEKLPGYLLGSMRSMERLFPQKSRDLPIWQVGITLPIVKLSSTSEERISP